MLCRSLQLPSDSSPLLRYFRGERRCNSGRCTPWQRFAANELKSKTLRQTRTIIQLMAAERLQRENSTPDQTRTRHYCRATCSMSTACASEWCSARRENSRGQGSQVIWHASPAHTILLLVYFSVFAWFYIQSIYAQTDN